MQQETLKQLATIMPVPTNAVVTRYFAASGTEMREDGEKTAFLLPKIQEASHTLQYHEKEFEDGDYTVPAIEMIVKLARERDDTPEFMMHCDLTAAREEGPESVRRKIISRIKNGQLFVAVDGRSGSARTLVLHSKAHARLFGVKNAAQPRLAADLNAGIDFVLYDGMAENEFLLHRVTEATLVVAYNEAELNYHGIFAVDEEQVKRQSLLITVTE